LPHFLRAVQVFFRLHSVSGLEKAVADVLDQLPFGVILVAASGKPLLVNRTAGEIAAARDGIILRPDRVEASSPQQTDRLLHLIAQASSACSSLTVRPGGTLRLTRSSSKPALVVLVAPIAGATSSFNVPGVGAVLFVTDPTTSLSQPPEAVSSLFDLTRAEARLCRHLTSGSSLGKAAGRMGISLNTARTHLKRIFDKTGTHRQSQLVLLLTQIMPCIRDA
jgi:DNA-binding CsgD family transcriptional regulator